MRGRGRRPRRPARPWASPMSSRGQRRAGDVAPYQVRAWRACADVTCVCGARCACADMVRCVVGADVPGGPRARGCPRWRSVGAARRGRRALPGARMACVCGRDVRVRRAMCVCGHGAVRGRGRRPRRPARPWVSPMAFRGRGAPGTSRPTRCAHGVRVRTWCACADMACVGGHGAVRGRGRRPGGPRPRGRSRCRSVGAARRGRRALPGARMACVCGARCACADMARCVVGADVPGGPRTRGRPRCRPVDVPWARRAGDVAPYQVRAWRACAARGVRVRTWRGAW